MKPKTISANPFQVTTAAAPFALDSAKFRTVESIRLYGPTSRTGIADLIGYSPSKLTGVVNDLIDAGILIETSAGISTGGRRARSIDFNPDYGYFVAATVESSRLEIALVDFSGHIRVRRLLHAPAGSAPQAVLDSICGFILERLEKLAIPLDKIYGFGLATPVAVEPASGTLYESADLPGWGGYQIESQLREVFPYGVVVIEKDANAMAYGELRRGRTNTDSLVFLRSEAPISAGIVIGGQIYRGASGRAGEIDRPASAELAALMAFIDPALIVIGSESAETEPLTFAAVSRQLLDVSGAADRRIERSALGAEAAITGLIARVAESVFVVEEK